MRALQETGAARGVAAGSRPHMGPILRRALAEFAADRIASVAAGITFYLLLALFPALACIVSLYGMFADRTAMSHDLQIFSSFLPEGANTVLGGELRHLLAQPPGKLGLGLVAGFVVAAWSASGGMKALIYGLNVAYETKETRGFLRLTFHALGLTASGIILALILIETANTAPIILRLLPFARTFKLLLDILAWPAAFIACAILSSLFYHYGANRARMKWTWITWGGAAASAIWIAGTVLFAWYVRDFGHYNEIYGNLGAVVGFLTWIWLSLVVLLLGAEINCEIERAGLA